MDGIEIPKIEGATAGAPMTAMPDDDLPLVLWLRGDEAIVEEFTVDADTAMRTLGIRRSRLNQISGRELRVGRIRIDKYVRPVYRPADLEAYLTATRPSVSHQKSAKAIDIAVDRLDHQRNELFEQFQQFRDVLTESIQQALTREQKTILNQLAASMDLLREDAKNLQQSLARSAHENKQLQQQVNHLQATMQQLQQWHQTQTAVQLERLQQMEQNWQQLLVAGQKQQQAAQAQVLKQGQSLQAALTTLTARYESLEQQLTLPSDAKTSRVPSRRRSGKKVPGQWRTTRRMGLTFG